MFRLQAAESLSLLKHSFSCQIYAVRAVVHTFCGPNLRAEKSRIESKIESTDGSDGNRSNRAEIDIHPTTYRTWYTLRKITIYISREGFTRISVYLRFRKLQTNKT